MAHSWTGFGLLIVAATLHSTVLVSKVERMRARRWPGYQLEVSCTIGETAFVWIALVSGLAVIVSQTRDAPPACGLPESILSTVSLLSSSVLSFFKLSKQAANEAPTQDRVHDARRDNTGTRIILAMIAIFAVAILLPTSLPWTSRFGLICFFRVVSTHVTLLIVSSIVVFRVGRYLSSRSRSGRMKNGMQRLEDDDEESLFSPSGISIHGLLALILVLACVALLSAFGFASREMEGNLGFWECWVVLTGSVHLRAEWALAQHFENDG